MRRLSADSPTRPIAILRTPPISYSRRGRSPTPVTAWPTACRTCSDGPVGAWQLPSCSPARQQPAVDGRLSLATDHHIPEARPALLPRPRRTEHAPDPFRRTRLLPPRPPPPPSP